MEALSPFRALVARYDSAKATILRLDPQAKVRGFGLRMIERLPPAELDALCEEREWIVKEVEAQAARVSCEAEAKRVAELSEIARLGERMALLEERVAVLEARVPPRAPEPSPSAQHARSSAPVMLMANNSTGPFAPAIPAGIDVGGVRKIGG
ncbi:hypothetical protein [Pseudolabrys taiwanensis]|uniref:hypothetical protein n=1 Tax=Pseudolabrys taiwanensis TaxID=331696 RepID=UPI0013B46929|nr:hypothetical protein [Pseudolabrys taiwanensis]